MNRRGARPAQVRPRPPGGSRPTPVKVRPRQPSPTRYAGHRPIERRRPLPLVVRVGLLAVVVAIGFAVLSVATGGLSRVVAAIGGSVEGFIDDITRTPAPSATAAVVADSPLLEAPAEPYTNAPTVDLVVTVPGDVVGDPDTFLRLYLALPDQAPAQIDELPMGGTRRMVIPDVALTPGRNDFSVTLDGPAGESDSSPVVTWILDQTPPKIEIAAPANGATINRAAVVISGKTQGRSALVARNDANNASITAIAEADGTFSLSLPLATGGNGIRITATDPAGNSGEATLSVKRGTGKLTAVVTSNPVRFSRQTLPRPVTFSVLVTDPDGRPLPGAAITFIVTTPGIPPVTNDTLTGADGKAAFQTTIPEGATTGTIGISVLVTTQEFGQTTLHSAVTITK